MTRRAVGMPCSWPSNGVITPPAGQPPGPGPSGGHEKHPGLAANGLTFVFQPGVAKWSTPHSQSASWRFDFTEVECRKPYTSVTPTHKLTLTSSELFPHQV